VRIVALVMKSNESITELRKIGKKDVGNIVRPTLGYAEKLWKQINPLLQKAIDAKEEGKTVDRDSLLRLFNSSNQDAKPKATSRKASGKKPSRSTSSASSNQVETLSDSAQDPTSRRSIRKRSAPELFVARPSKFSGGVEEGDEEFLAAFTLTDLRKSSSNSSQQSKHPSYYLLQEASVLFSGINETNAAQTFHSIDCLFSKGSQRNKNSRWTALKELHSKHPSYHLIESQRALNKTQKPTKKVASKKKKMMKKSASLSEGDSSDNKATTVVKAGLKNCPELGPGWKVEMVPRKKGERKDKYYYSSTGERFRSLAQARASMNDMKIDNDDSMEIDSDDESEEDSGKTNSQFFGHELFGPQLLKTKYESLIPIGAHGNKLSLGTFILASDAALAFDKASNLLNKNVPSSKVRLNFANEKDHIELRNKEMSVRGIDDVDLKEVMTEVSTTLNGIMSKIETP